MLQVASRQALYDHFDNYTLARKEELNQRSLKRGSGLLKAYLIETYAGATNGDIIPTFEEAGWKLQQIDTALYQVVNLSDDTDGFIDVFTPRYHAFYTTAKSDESDTLVKRAVRQSVSLDHVWLSSPILQAVWKELIPTTNRYATLRFENEPLFDFLDQNPQFDDLPDDDLENTSEDDEQFPEQQIARLEIKQRISQLRELPEKDTVLGNLLGNLTRVRAPSPNQQGRYEYFQYGKLTNRGNEFRGFHSYLTFIAQTIYGHLTELIEERVSFYLERQQLPSGSERIDFRGAPVTFTFYQPLSVDVFERFIHLTFDRGQGPFRLWGNPLRLSGPKVQVYGVDLHLWQQIYLELTPRRFTLILPQGTCGNTVHRLATNIQRYLDPQVVITIGDTDYGDLIRQAMRSV